MICYLDTSAAMKLLVEESESVALTTYLQLAVALRVGADQLITYDTELAAAADAAGILAVGPS